MAALLAARSRTVKCTPVVPLLLTWVLSGGACSLPEVDLDNKTCPCASGWVCDDTLNLCVSRGTPRQPSSTGMPRSESPITAGPAETDAGMPDASAAPVNDEDEAVTEEAPAGQPSDGAPPQDLPADDPPPPDTTPQQPDEPLPPPAEEEDPAPPDEDALPDANDPSEPDTAPGPDCDQDSDGDGTDDCSDGCPNDPGKVAPLICGCGVTDDDDDGDGAPSCVDECPLNPGRTIAGECGCDAPPGPPPECGQNADPQDDAGGDDPPPVQGCGDGVLDPAEGEFCDDGNTEGGDGCSADCFGEALRLGGSSETAYADDSTINLAPSSADCGRDAVGAGFHVQSGSWVDRIGLLCQPVDLSFRPDGGRFDSDAVGDEGGGKDDTVLQCANGEYLVALSATHDSHFRALTGHCRPAASIRAAASNEHGTNQTMELDTGRRSGSATTTLLACPNGSVVTGIAGRKASDGAPSLLYLICNAMDE